MADLLPVEEALARILAGAERLGEESVPLDKAFGRVLASPLAARRTQPPLAVSAMDGYAVRAADVAAPGAALRLVGESVAGAGFSGRLDPGTCVRILTGAPVPDGADAILIQEEAQLAGALVSFAAAARPGQYVRRAGLDFSAGEVLLEAGRRLSPEDVALAAAMDYTALPVARRPRVAIIATGDELVRPGEPAGPHQIVASNPYAVAGIVEAEGGLPLDLGIAPDRIEDLLGALADARARGADVVVTLGGASVGDRDLVRAAFLDAGVTVDFWRIAMRPGKPMMFGRAGTTSFLGLPGNPVSAITCARLFLIPLLRAVLGRPDVQDQIVELPLGGDLPANDRRQDYLRARIERAGAERRVVPFAVQDSSMLRYLAEADCLLVRPPYAPAASAGTPVPVLLLKPAALV